MRYLPNYTNGFMILSDSFSTEIFKQSFLRMFSKDGNQDLNMGFNATLDVLTSREIKISGLIGHAISGNKTGSSIGETVTINNKRKLELAILHRGKCVV